MTKIKATWGVQQEHSLQDVRIKPSNLVTTPDLRWNCVQFWAQHFKGLPVEESLRTEIGTIKGLENIAVRKI